MYLICPTHLQFFQHVFCVQNLFESIDRASLSVTGDHLLVLTRECEERTGILYNSLGKSQYATVKNRIKFPI